MDSMEVNKGIAAILVAGIVFFLTGLIGDALVRERLPEKQVLNIAAAPASTGGGAAQPAPALHLHVRGLWQELQRRLSWPKNRGRSKA
jgi:hypothetical protein